MNKFAKIFDIEGFGQFLIFIADNQKNNVRMAKVCIFFPRMENDNCDKQSHYFHCDTHEEALAMFNSVKTNIQCVNFYNNIKKDTFDFLDAFNEHLEKKGNREEWLKIVAKIPRFYAYANS